MKGRLRVYRTPSPTIRSLLRGALGGRLASIDFYYNELLLLAIRTGHGLFVCKTVSTNICSHIPIAMSHSKPVQYSGAMVPICMVKVR
jgi:hypothetical protein